MSLLIQLALFTFIFLVFGVIAAVIPNGNPVKAFFLGFLLGPLGVAFVLLFELGKCSYCGTPLAPNVKICPGCKCDVVTIRHADGKLIWPCSHCGAMVKNKSEYAGRSFPCPLCKNEISVPTQNEIGKQITMPKAKETNQ